MDPTLVSVASPPDDRRVVEPVETIDSDLDKLDHPVTGVRSDGRGPLGRAATAVSAPYSATVGRAARLNGRAAWSPDGRARRDHGRDRRTGGWSSPSRPWR